MLSSLHHDPNFSELRSNQLSTEANWVLSYTGAEAEDTVVPGIIDVADILGCGAYSGLPHPTKPQISAFEIENGADIIVTVLYQYRPSVLRQFLDLPGSKVFTYTHKPTPNTQTSATSQSEARPFVITRKGHDVQAGFRSGCNNNGEVLSDWAEVVSYEILPTGSWRQLYYDCPGIDSMSNLGMVATDAVTTDELHQFEDVAVLLLRPAITQRLWHSHPGKSTIEITEKAHEHE